MPPGRFDEHPVKDRFAAVQFQFYTDSEIEKISVQKIVDPIAFDNLNNPTKNGLHAKTLGVSPFDHKSMCVTCGMSVNFCPGHLGHIELTVPLFNPFLVKDIYKLLKSKCFACHRLRIHPTKIETYTMAFKLLKAGDMVVSSELKSYLMHAAAQYVSCPESALVDANKMRKLKGHMDSLAPQGVKLQKVNDKLDLAGYFTKIEHRVNESKEKFEEDLKEKLEEILDLPGELQANTSMQRRMSDLLKEIWANVVTTVCPHCRFKSPAVKRDGFTKLFIKPLQKSVANNQKQSKALSKALANKGKKGASKAENLDADLSEENNDPLDFDQELASLQSDDEKATNKDQKVKKGKNSTSRTADQSEVEQDDEAMESSEEEEYKEGGAQKFITVIEIEDHIRKLWQREEALLSLIYGRFDPSQALKTDSLGYQQFFMRKMLVPPTRFRPESEGSLGGGGSSQGDRAYLHTHSAMLTKVIQKNIALSEALVEERQQKEGQMRGGDKGSSAPISGAASTQGAGSVATSATGKANTAASGAAQKEKGSEINKKWIQLQDAANIFMDSSMAQKTVDKATPGVRQLLERKEGMFRMKMMGKRVNFGGRSVISPDPNITTDQIGVPVFMARKLTFPESVSQVNIAKLRQLVRNGAGVHPGANIVEDEESGQQYLLAGMSDEDREGIAEQLLLGRKIVHRHLTNGDVLLVNRQPTLHKPSIMAHLARILPKEQTLRLHYANCSTYNADFDGDEMNIHFPQSYQAASEAYKLMATHKQYVVPTSGKPIRGLIQDSVVSGVVLTSKDSFMPREQYMQLVYAGLRELLSENKLLKVETLAPTIIKPRPLWSGKQVISTILKNIVLSGLSPKQVQRQKKICGMNLDGKARLNPKEWGPLGKEEGEVIIRDNEHLQGTLDKNAFGSSDQGMVHAFYELYGSQKAGDLLTALARIFAVMLQTQGLTVGLDDLVLRPEFNKQRRMAIEKNHREGVISAAKFAGLKDTFKFQNFNYSNRVVFQSKDNFDKEIDKFTKMALPENPFDGKKKCMHENDPIRVDIEKKFVQSASNIEALDMQLDNEIKQTMSKATSSILENCIPQGLVKKFPKNNISTMVLTGAKGSTVNQTQISALLGQQELEGRRVPRMQNGKTLPCFLPYDPNPRASGYVSDRFISGLRPQDFFFHCMAGREGLIDTAVKTSRSGYLQRCLIKQLESLVVSYDMTVRDNDGSIVQFMYGDDGVDVMETKFLDKFKFLERNCTNLGDKSRKLLQSGVVDIEPIQKAKKIILKKAKTILNDSDGMLPSDEARKMASDPLLSLYHPLRHFGAISEQMESQLRQFVKKDSLQAQAANSGKYVPKFKCSQVEPEQLKEIFYMKYMKAVVHPGENVGTIAAQSIGEPSTQMTLNTFHLAGHGGANMTLGIPRLKEILMTTPTNIKTPFMTVFLQKDKVKSMSMNQLQTLANSFEKMRFTEVVQNIALDQTIEKGVDSEYKRIYKLTLTFDDAKKLKSKLDLKYSQLAHIFVDKFVPKLMDLALKDLRKAAEIEMGGLSSSGMAQDNATNLKNVISKTTKLTKVSKGDAAEANNNNAEDEFDQGIQRGETDFDNSSQQGQGAGKNNEDSDEDDRSVDMLMDTDGVVKSSKKPEASYGANDEEFSSDNENGSAAQDKKRGSAADEEMEGNEGLVVDEKDIQNEKDAQSLMRLLREKHSKYLQFIKGDLDFKRNKSVSITLQFPLEFKKLLLLSLAETALDSILVRHNRGIEKCMVIPAKGSTDPHLLVQGINFGAFERHPDFFDLTRLQTNHSYMMKERYGIEACRANIVKEIRSVFGVYGISVDYRHLSLICDFVTYSGDYRAFNRIGMEESSSPFLKMSYETTMKYLVASSTQKDTDYLSSPASALVLGLVPKVGTNAFDVIHETIPTK